MPLGGLLTAGIGALAPIVGGAIGNAASAGDRDKAAAAQAAALKAIQGLSPPEAEKLMVEFQKYQQTGEVSPALQSVIQQQSSEMRNISTDPRLQQAQMGALQKLQQLGKGGLQPEDIAALSKASQQAGAMGQSQQASALQAMQQRGIGGSGSELASRLAAAQGASNQVMQGGLDIQGQASQRALQAIMSSGQLGGQMQERSFGQQAQQSAAQDAINRYNAINSQQTQGQNVGERNKAEYYNVGQKQNISNMNTAGVNDTAIRNAAAQQQAYQNEYQKALAVSGANNTAAGQHQTNAGQTQQMWGGIGQGVGQAAGAVGAAQNNAKWLDIFKQPGAPKVPVAPTPVSPVNPIDDLYDKDGNIKGTGKSTEGLY